LERALAIAEAAYGPEHPEVGTRLNNLALVLRDLGDLAGARERFERALAIDLAAYGPEHPDVGTDLNNLALVLQDLGDLAGARERLERALAIAEARPTKFAADFLQPSE
jgi:tetratricopeptide (TPR) repeat protein